MKPRPSALHDFTVDHRVWLLTGAALFIGAGAAALAVVLLRCFALATNDSTTTGLAWHWLGRQAQLCLHGSCHLFRLQEG